MTAVKQFLTQRRAADDPQATIAFEIPAGSGRVYYATADPPGGVMLISAALEGASIRQQMASLGMFLDSVLLPESRRLFEEALYSPDPAINIKVEEASEVVRWLIEDHYVGRPTSRSSASSSAASADGRSSTGDSPNGDSTP